MRAAGDTTGNVPSNEVPLEGCHRRGPPRAGPVRPKDPPTPPVMPPASIVPPTLLPCGMRAPAAVEPATVMFTGAGIARWIRIHDPEVPR